MILGCRRQVARMPFLLTVALGVLVSLTATHVFTLPRTAPKQSSSSLRPYNLVLVTIDTMRADRMGAYGNASIKTPNLDGVADRGVLFEQAVAQVPLTPPSHASMFTGTYPTVHQVRDTGGFILSPSHTTLAETLAAQGWQTAAFVGSAVLGRVFGLNQGFQTYDDQISRRDADRVSFEFPYRRAAAVVERALQWFGGRKPGTPYFLWVHVFDPHTPYDPPPPYDKLYKSAYDGEVAYVDSQLGRLFQALQGDSAWKDTLVVVLADHGESLSEHGEYSHGVFLYDSTLRIPWVMAGPGVPAGLRVSQQARTIDLLPTVLDLLGVEKPGGCQGVSLVPAFSHKPVGSTYSYSETLFPKINMGWAELRAIRTNKWKYVHAPRPELYDLESDPAETANVIGRNNEIARKLLGELRKVASAGESDGAEEVNLANIDPATLEQLKALGYVSVGRPRTLQLTGEGIDPKDRLEILRLLEEATTTQDRKPSAERIALLEQALEEDPTNTAVFYILGEAYERNRRDRDALELYRKAVAQEATATNKIYARMAGVYGRLGRIKESIAAFEKAIEIDPTDLPTQNRLALVFMSSGNVAKAQRILHGILALDGKDARAHNSLGWIALHRKQLSAARRHFDQALAADPNLLEVYVNLGMLHKASGDSTRARKAFETFLEKASGLRNYQDSVRQIKKELASLPPSDSQ